MATRKEQEVLHTNLRKWFNVLGYRVTDTELKVITKNSRNAEFWRLVQKLVLPGGDIKTIRSKLAGYQRKQDYNKVKQDVSELQKQKEELMAKISASKARSSQSIAGISTMKTKIKVDANSKTDKLQQLSTSTLKDILRKSLTNHCSKIQAKFDINSNSLHCSTLKRTKAVMSNEASTLMMTGNKGMIETECSRSIQAILDQIKQYLEVHISQPSQDSTVKNKLWEDAVKIHDQFSPSEILATILAIASEESTSLINQANTMSIEKDLKNLNFDVIDGDIVSKGDDNDPEKALESHAIALQTRVRKEWIDMLNCRNESRELQKTLNILQTEVENKVQSLLWSSEEKSALSALLKFKLREKELISKDITLKNELQRLSDDKERATKEKIQTMKTHRSIMDFKRNQEKKRMVIEALVGQTGSLKAALNSQTASIAQFIEGKLIPAKDVISSRLDSIKCYPEVLSTTLANVPLDRLYLSPLPSGTCPVSDLSIYQFEKSTNYHKLLLSTSVPLHLDSESFIKHVSTIITSYHSENMTYGVLNDMIKCYENNVPNSADVFEALREALFDFDTFTSENILERIKRHEEKFHGSIKKASSIKRMIHTFADQPAQYLIPWVKVDDTNMKDVQEQWLVKSSVPLASSAVDVNLITLSNIYINERMDSAFS